MTVCIEVDISWPLHPLVGCITLELIELDYFPDKTVKFALSAVILHAKVRRLAWGSNPFRRKFDSMSGH